MYQPLYCTARHAGVIAALTGLAFCCAIVQAQPADSSNDQAIGRINFDSANLPPANVELDLGQRMFSDVFGITDAAVAGVADALTKSTHKEHGESTRLAADKLNALRQIIGLSNKVVREVRVRAYEKMSDDLASRFEGQLRDGNWEKVIVLRKGNENARVYVIHKDDSIRGVFVIAAGQGGQALVNVVCDLSPDNVKNLTSAATQIGLDNGLAQALEIKFRKMQNRTGPPQPPRPPQVPQPKREVL